MDSHSVDLITIKDIWRIPDAKDFFVNDWSFIFLLLMNINLTKYLNPVFVTIDARIVSILMISVIF